MKAKNAMYAAVGAPIVAARALNARLGTLREEMESRGEGLSDRAQHLIEEWSQEGRHAMEKVSEGKVVDEFTSRVDFEQAREQVGKLREQLEEMLATWRTSFRPEAVGQAEGETGGTEVEIPDRAEASPDEASGFPTEAEMLLPDREAGQEAADQGQDEPESDHTEQ